MALWPPSLLGLSHTIGMDTSTSSPTTLTSGGTAHTKGVWVELVSSTLFDADGLWLRVHTYRAVAGQATPGLIDIGIGADTVEQVVVADLFNSYDEMPGYWIPIRIPRGSRLSARWQTPLASVTTTVSCVLVAGTGHSSTVSHTYGVDSATSGGTMLPTGMAANTKSAWTELVSATTAPIRYVIPMAMPGPTDVALGIDNVLFDFAFGPSGLETQLVSNLCAVTSSAEVFRYPKLVVPVRISAGSRLAARYQRGTAISEAMSVAVVCCG